MVSKHHAIVKYHIGMQHAAVAHHALCRHITSGSDKDILPDCGSGLDISCRVNEPFGLFLYEEIGQCPDIIQAWIVGNDMATSQFADVVACDYGQNIITFVQSKNRLIAIFLCENNTVRQWRGQLGITLYGCVFSI